MAASDSEEQFYRLSPAVHEEERESVNDSILASGGFDVDSFTRDHLHCPSCGKYYDDPRTLPCLDSYCRECLEKEAREQKEEREREREREAREREGNGQIEEEGEDLDESYLETLRSSYNLTPSSTGGLTNEYSEPLSDNFDCPQGCQCPTGIKFHRDGDIDHIPPANKFLANMVEDVRLKKEVPAGKVLCGNCEDGKIAVAICNNHECANLPLCSDCFDIHLKTSKTKEHCIVCPNPETLEGSNGTRDWKNFPRHNWNCDFHHHPVDRYCYEHEEVICCECAALGGDDEDDEIGHRNCKKVRLTEKCIDREAAAIVGVINEVHGIHDKIKTAINKIENMKQSVTDNKNDAIAEINEHCNKLIADLEGQKERLVNQTREIHNRKMDNLKEHQDGLKRISDTLQRSIDFIGGSVNMAIPTEFMFLKKSFHERLNYLKEHYKDYDMLPSDVNQKIHLKLNDGFSVEGALGEVVGTPFIENYTLESFPNPVRSRRAYLFKIQSRDICRTEVAGNLPMLEATICSLANLEPVQCFVKLNDEKGVYTVYFYPFRAGRHKISVYCPQTRPLEDLFVRGCPFYIDVRR